MEALTLKEIAKALQELNFETYIDKFDMRAFRQNHIYPDIWGYEDEADLIKESYILDVSTKEKGR